MILLVRAEMRRLVSRRLFRVLLFIVVSLIVVIGTLILTQRVRIGFVSDAPLAMRVAAQPLFSLGVVVGASFVGAEWATGGMTTLLTWEPRRGRVLAAKLIAAVAVVAAAVLAIEILVAISVLPAAVVHGSTAGIDGQWWLSALGLWLRTAALSSMGAALGVGLAGLMRNSAGPVATWLIFEFLAAPLLVLWKPGLFRWLPAANVQRFLSSHESFGVTIDQPTSFSVSVLRAGLVLAAYALALVAASYASFRTRDVN